MSADDPKICFCHDVRKSEIQEVFKTHAPTIREVQAETCASTGCGGCEPDIRDLIQEFSSLSNQSDS